jgi:predicted metal-binding protein
MRVETTKVGIIRCLSNARRCPATGCLKVIKEKEGNFKDYGDIELVGITTCSGCPAGDTKTDLEEVELLLNRGAEVIHTSNCAVSLRPFLSKLNEDIQKAHPSPKLVTGTHSNRLAWAGIRDQYPRVVV